jgi:hypothetical protein
MTWHADHTFTATITGGSIAGLCNALTLRSIGAAPRKAALVAETSDPFPQTIIDLTVPRTLFGRVLLLQLEYGNALFEYGLALGNRWTKKCKPV